MFYSRNGQNDGISRTVLDAIDSFDQLNFEKRRASANLNILNGEFVTVCSDKVSILLMLI